MFKEIILRLIEYTKSNKGKTFGILTGFLIAVFIIVLGFFKTIFIVLCSCLGYYIGKKIDNGDSLKDVFYKIFELNNKF